MHFFLNTLYVHTRSVSVYTTEVSPPVFSLKCGVVLVVQCTPWYNLYLSTKILISWLKHAQRNS